MLHHSLKFRNRCVIKKLRLINKIDLLLSTVIPFYLFPYTRSNNGYLTAMLFGLNSNFMATKIRYFKGSLPELLSKIKYFKFRYYATLFPKSFNSKLDLKVIVT